VNRLINLHGGNQDGEHVAARITCPRARPFAHPTLAESLNNLFMTLDPR
jgi:hypothetical protein